MQPRAMLVESMKGKDLKAAREELRMDRARLAIVFDVDRATIWRWEKLKRVPKLVEWALLGLRSDRKVRA
jgi:DNA-binding transcriptional regulator YiaG